MRFSSELTCTTMYVCGGVAFTSFRMAASAVCGPASGLGSTRGLRKRAARIVSYNLTRHPGQRRELVFPVVCGGAIGKASPAASS
jgi:hypothetical protein